MIKRLKSIKKRYMLKGSFGHSVITMITGTSIAQILPIAIAPILTRLYSPQEFGIFAIYMALVSIISLVSTGRYELAIMLTKKEEESINIVFLSFFIVVLVSLLTLVGLLVIKGHIMYFLGNDEIAIWLLSIPLLVFITGSFQVLKYWVISNKMFKRLAINKVCQSATTAGVQVGGGYLSHGAGGLILGQVMGQGVGTAFLGWKMWKENKSKSVEVRLGTLIKQAKRYKKFPIYSLAADLINLASNQIPNLLLGGFFGLSIVGFFSLTQKVLGSPTSLIAGSILDVFRERASRDYLANGNCLDIYIKTFKSLFLISVIPFIVCFFVAPVLIPFVFGSNWKIAGEYTQILSIMFFFRFISSPLSYVLYVAEKQNYDFIWQIILFVFMLISISIGWYLNSAKISILCFSLAYSLMYIFYLLLSFNVARGQIK
jgi:O-antigen/teichoic acid export membrane protein